MFAAEWLESKHNLKPVTRARYRVVLDTFIAAHADVAVGDISRELVRGWVAELELQPRPGIGHHKAVGVLRQVLAMAVADNRLVVNPVDGVELPAVGP